MNLDILFNDLDNYVINSNKNIDKINEFLDYYNTIIEKDKIQPIFSQTTKYNNQFNQYQKKKYNSINRKSQKWKSNNNLSDKEKIQKLIIQYFNKLSNVNYDNVVKDFMNDILKISNNILFDIIAEQIIIKCINDKQYQNEYIKICNVIWTNTNILKNFINILEENGKFYYIFKLNDKTKYGPFKNINELKDDVINKYNFKNVLLKYLKLEFYKKTEYVKEYNDTEVVEKKFKTKRKIFGIIEILVLLYNYKYIDYNIINTVINDLLSNPNEIYFELVFYICSNIHHSYNYNYFKKNILIYKNNKKFNHRTQYFIDSILELMVNNRQKARNKYNNYMSNENVSKSQSQSTNKTNTTKITKPSYNIENDEELFILNINKRDKKKIIEIISFTKEKDEFLYTLFYSYFEKESNSSFVKEIFAILMKNNIINKSLIDNTYKLIDENREDLMVDIINFDEKYNNLKNELSNF